MAKLAAHLRTARKEGPQAGFDAWYERLNEVTGEGTRGLPTVRELLDEVNEVGGMRTRGRNAGTFKSPDKALAFYCNKYEHELNNATTTRPKRKAGTRTAASTTRTTRRSRANATQETPQEAVDPQVAAIADALKALGFDIPGMPADDDEDDDGTQTQATRRTSRATQQTPEPEAQVYPPPRDPDANATQGKLWKLNELGLLAIMDEPGDPITAGEAYDTIGEWA